LPLGTIPATKTLVLDIQAALVAAGRPVPERMEGLAIGPQLADGSYSLVIGTDNDFSIAEIGGTLSDVFLDGTFGPVGGDPMGRTLFPSQIFMFRSELPNYVRPVPEPNAFALVCGGIVILVVFRRRGYLPALYCDWANRLPAAWPAASRAAAKVRPPASTWRMKVW
jgi:hypothetical protein